MNKQIAILKYYMTIDDYSLIKQIQTSLIFLVITLVGFMIDSDYGLIAPTIVCTGTISLIIGVTFNKFSPYHYSINLNIKNMTLLFISIVLITITPSIIIIQLFKLLNDGSNLLEILIQGAICIITSITLMFSLVYTQIGSMRFFGATVSGFTHLGFSIAFILTISIGGWAYIIYPLGTIILIALVIKLDNEREFI